MENPWVWENVRIIFFFTFDKVAYQPGKLEAVSYDGKGKEVSRYTLFTAGEAACLKLTAVQNPEGFHADGADMALLQVEVVDKDGRRCSLDNRTVRFTLKGEAEWRGGIAQGKRQSYLGYEPSGGMWYQPCTHP